VRPIRLASSVARWLGIAAAIAAALLVLALWDDGWWLAAAVLAAVPAGILYFFSLTLNEVAELPARLRGAPAEARAVVGAFDDVRTARGMRFGSALWRAGRRTASARDLAMPWAPLLPLVSVTFWIAAAVSAVAVPFLLVAALAALAAAT